MSIKRKRLREKTQKKNCNKINCEMKNRNQKLIEKDNYIFRKKQILDRSRKLFPLALKTCVKYLKHSTTCWSVDYRAREREKDKFSVRLHG